ncbi:transcriptional repressor RbsR [Raoultella planticola]|uniref:Transcriptional repressor RbsR n=1 Tax=Raoultella planticola TaxID=575 RepID=A0A485BBQ8_RAOPL|nr:transcriptional repressor RbsR [Raoultella planticola]
MVNAVGMREEGLNRLQQSALPMVLIDRKIPDFACDVVGLDNTQAATTATEHLVEKGFEALLFLSEPLGSVNTRRERLSAFRATLQRYAGIVAENAEVPLNDGAMLDTVLRQFHSRHRGMRKALISANGALTLQVARALKRIDLVWGSDIGLLGFDELEWAELAAWVLPRSNSPRGRLAMPRLSRWCAGLKALTTPSASGSSPVN